MVAASACMEAIVMQLASSMWDVDRIGQEVAAMINAMAMQLLTNSA